MTHDTVQTLEKNIQYYKQLKKMDRIIYQPIEIKLNRNKRMAILVRNSTDSYPASLPLEIHYEYSIRNHRPDFDVFETVLIPKLYVMAGIRHTGQICYGLLTFEREA